MPELSTPGWVDADLPQSVKTAWSEFQSKRATADIRKMLQAAGASSDRQIAYEHPLAPRDPVDPVKRELLSIGWDGFPESVSAHFPGNSALTEAETLGYEDLAGFGEDAGWSGITGNGEEVDLRVRHRQDEYLEWGTRRVGGKLASVTFVAEAWDYFRFLFENGEHDRIADYYGRWTDSPNITASDLRAHDNLSLIGPGVRPQLIAPRNGFNPRNQHNNIRGIVHLSHIANNLGAEITLAVTSAIPRLDGAGKVVRDESSDGAFPKRLLCCTRGGEPNRSSDALIAAGAYREITHPKDPKVFTLADPIGLYIRTFRHSALELPKGGGSAPRDWWHVDRGADATDLNDPVDSRILRLRVEVPPSEKFLLGDMTVDGAPLRNAGQLAKLIRMHLLVEAWKERRPLAKASCRGGCCTNGTLLRPFTGRPRCPNGWDDAFAGLTSDDATIPSVVPEFMGNRQTP